ncbi:MAG TPA: MFS transporter [Victivallales bacterium]|nr:MFS transporter [Victivallales bacterium]
MVRGLKENGEFNKERAILLVMPWVIFLQFMQLFNENLFTIATPEIAHTFSLSPSVASIVITIAGVSFGVGGGIYAVLCDIISVRKLFVFGVIIFCIGSVLGFIFQNYYFMIVLSRFIQTLGSGVIPGAIYVLIARYVPDSKKSKYYGYSSAMFQLSAGIGYCAGGYITTYFEWQYGFLIPLISLICLPVFLKYLPNEELRSKKIDLSGAILLAGLICFFILSLALLKYTYLIIAIIFTILFISHTVIRMKKGRDIFVSFSMFKNVKFIFGILVGFLTFCVQMGVFFILPFIMKDVYAVNSTVLGDMFIPASFAAFLVGANGGRFVRIFGRERCSYIGVGSIVLGLCIIAGFMGSSVAFVLVGLILFSCGFPLFFVTFMDLFTAGMPAHSIGSGLGIYNILTYFVSSLIPTIIGLALTYKIFNVRVMPILSGKSICVNYSNIVYILALMEALGIIIFYIVYCRKSRKPKKG